VVKQTLRLGEKGTIVLNVFAYPQLTYKWMKDGQPVAFDVRTTLNRYSGSITFNPVRQSDEGNYTCEITDSQGASHTFDNPPIEVKVIGKLSHMLHTRVFVNLTLFI